MIDEALRPRTRREQWQWFTWRVGLAIDIGRALAGRIWQTLERKVAGR